MKLAQEQCSAAELQQSCSAVAVKLQRIGSKYAAELQQIYSRAAAELQRSHMKLREQLFLFLRLQGVEIFFSCTSKFLQLLYLPES